MKWLLFLFVTVASCALPSYAATCSGGANCHACKNCHYCGHCAKGGGICSVCHAEAFNGRSFGTAKSSAPSYYSPPKEIYSNQQQATREPSWIRQQRLEKGLGVKMGAPAAKPVNYAPLTSFTGICTAVTSGDSIEVRHGAVKETVYLYSIKAPAKGEALFEKSRLALSALVLNQRVTVYPKVRANKANVLGWVFIGSTPVNMSQVAKGNASWNKTEAPGESNIAKAEVVARSGKVGIWADVR